jgi:hypothetical protein
MKVDVITENDETIAIVRSDEIIITDGQSALDFMATVSYEYDCRKIALNKSAVDEDFFHLKTGLAGEVLQKFVNYNMNLAIIGDFFGYTSKPLNDFIYESNNGQQVFFVASENEAVKKLSGNT